MLGFSYDLWLLSPAMLIQENASGGAALNLEPTESHAVLQRAGTTMVFTIPD